VLYVPSAVGSALKKSMARTPPVSLNPKPQGSMKNEFDAVKKSKQDTGSEPGGFVSAMPIVSMALLAPSVIVNGVNARDSPVVTKSGAVNEKAKASIGALDGVKLKLYNCPARAVGANADKSTAARRAWLRAMLRRERSM